LCYEKFVNNHWEIFTNNISGINPQNISNYYDDDEYPQWSPDGRYIVYSRSQPIGGLLIIVYDTKTQTSKDISDGGEADLQPQWTPDSKVFFGYPHTWSKYQGTYLMNPDGSDRKKILDTTGTIYFYNDSYTFLYIVDTKVYKTNIDNSLNELVLELPSHSSNDFVTIRDFNPLTGDLLVNTNTISGSSNAIATFNVENKLVKLLIAAEVDYVLYL
jgi:Tol biopolymer transport system component